LREPSNKVVNISDLTSNSHQSQSMGKTKPNLKEMSQKTKNKTEKQFEQHDSHEHVQRQQQVWC
jgi:hypothetical protein